jgi:hypothetical protein
MFWPKKDREKDRFYLLPGQGGRAYRRKQKYILTCAGIVALIVAAIVGTAIYWMNRPR